MLKPKITTKSHQKSVQINSTQDSQSCQQSLKKINFQRPDLLKLIELPKSSQRQYKEQLSAPKSNNYSGKSNASNLISLPSLYQPTPSIDKSQLVLNEHNGSNGKDQYYYNKKYLHKQNSQFETTLSKKKKIRPLSFVMHNKDKLSFLCQQNDITKAFSPQKQSSSISTNDKNIRAQNNQLQHSILSNNENSESKNSNRENSKGIINVGKIFYNPWRNAKFFKDQIVTKESQNTAIDQHIIEEQDEMDKHLENNFRVDNPLNKSGEHILALNLNSKRLDDVKNLKNSQNQVELSAREAFNHQPQQIKNVNLNESQPEMEATGNLDRKVWKRMRIQTTQGQRRDLFTDQTSLEKEFYKIDELFQKNQQILNEYVLVKGNLNKLQMLQKIKGKQIN